MQCVNLYVMKCSFVQILYILVDSYVLSSFRAVEHTPLVHAVESVPPNVWEHSARVTPPPAPLHRVQSSFLFPCPLQRLLYDFTHTHTPTSNEN